MKPSPRKGYLIAATKDYPDSDFSYPEIKLSGRDQAIEEAKQAEDAQQSDETTPTEDATNTYKQA